jgi:hypothetical protein
MEAVAVNQALRIAQLYALGQALTLPLEEIQTRIVRIGLRDIERIHHRDFINILPILDEEETRALYSYLIRTYVSSVQAEAA